jgi:hypothetical protein
MQTESLFEKIKQLPRERIAEGEDFVDFIAQRNAAAARHESIAAYAAEYGGSTADLDPEMEAAAVDHLREIQEVNR